ncbi:MAG: sugar transporter [Proteobacteria bacterium]|nr:MAG: sugar transporter [Pseudomonadota bacterium]
MHPTRGLRASLALAAALLSAACASDIPRLPDDRAVIEAETEYRIGPGDLLSVKFFYTNDLNEDLVVRPDGRISLQLVGELMAAGRTPAELSSDLQGLYAAHLLKPAVTVIVRGFASHKAFVGGEVKGPTAVPIDGRTTLADAVFQAGGPLDTAALSSVILLRKGAEGREAYRVDLSDGLMGREPLPVLRPYDVVFLPKSFIGKVGMYVELYINRIVPRNGSFMAFYELNPVDIPNTNTPAAGSGAGGQP